MGVIMSGPRPLPKSRRAGLDTTEKAWQAQVIQLARLCGWQHFHTYDSRRSVPGVPDLLLVRPPRVLFVELKSRTGRISPAQQQWLDLLGDCPGVETFTWRPDDLAQVRAVLARRHRP